MTAQNKKESPVSITQTFRREPVVILNHFHRLGSSTGKIINGKGVCAKISKPLCLFWYKIAKVVKRIATTPSVIAIVETINNTPRKCLGFKTPCEVLKEHYLSKFNYQSVALEGKMQVILNYYIISKN